jgi:hypothetical protein
MRFDTEWLTNPKEPAASEELLTRCRLSLEFRNYQLFRHESLMDEHQVKDTIAVSAYPLALWFAANWWRLRWEPRPAINDASGLHDWNMSHALAAAGGGYAWPDLTFASDGESVQFNLKPSWESRGPVRYIERLDAWAPAEEFETGVDGFINHTLEQLSSIEQTPLNELWRTVCEERAAPLLAQQRQLEAKLGYDPEEAPESLLALLTRLISVHGEGPVQELACLGYKRAEKTIQDAQRRLADTGDSIALPLKSVRKFSEMLLGGKPGHPWRIGRDAANQVRNHLGIDKGPLSNRKFAELLATPEQLLDNDQATQPLPIGIGEVSDNGRAKVALGKKRKDARRFMAARLMADGIYAGETGNWLPCTDASTVRQKFQRAFAQEFLCPYSDLIEWMDTTSPDEELMDAAAECFEVSPLLINTVMVNHGHIPRSELEAFQQAV